MRPPQTSHKGNYYSVQTMSHYSSTTRKARVKRNRLIFSGFTLIGLAIYFSLLSHVLRSRIQHSVPILPTSRKSAKKPSSLKYHRYKTDDDSTAAAAATVSNNYWERNIQIAEHLLGSEGPQSVRKVLTAYVEPPLNDTIQGTGNQGNIDDDKDPGMPPQFYTPLPLRTTTPEDLVQWKYPKLQTCHDLPAKLPVDRGLELDDQGNTMVHNVGNNEPTPANYPYLEAPYCPVDADPFLPWIHDVFPSVDGTRLEFIAQNRRRCKTGKNHRKDVERLAPQVALLQSVSVERINERKAQLLAPELWRSSTNRAGGDVDDEDAMPRYRLSPYEEASPDGMETRFICRFHTTDFKTGQPILLNETLSQYPFNYEFVGYRKNKPHLLTPRGKDTNMFWTSTLRFYCPIPPNLQSLVRDGNTILSDGTPTLFADVIPIRTSPRYGASEVYFTEDMAGPRASWETSKPDIFSNNNTSSSSGFNATTRWGTNNVLPRVEASGRWENIPLCQPPTVELDKTERTILTTSENNDALLKEQTKEAVTKKKPHTLSACLWAAESFKTRGVRKESGATRDTKHRLVEWMEFHLMVGFDHIYVYDNSGAHTNDTSLEDITSRYPSSKVTRIDWPSLVCNNNIPAHDNTGERSSQYAAENSCRTRFAPYTEWIGSFDTDEYLVPMGNYTSLKDVVRDAQKKGTNILSFRSSRGRLRFDASRHISKGREMIPDKMFLEAYNCDSAPAPKPSWADRARKQLYRSDYVLYHYVHYSTVTQGYAETFVESQQKSKKWNRFYSESQPSERVTDEMNEATMIHTKGTDEKLTNNYLNRCHFEFEMKWRGCYVGFPWPNDTEVPGAHDGNGMEYNCFINRRVENYWLPRLRSLLQESAHTSTLTLPNE